MKADVTAPTRSEPTPPWIFIVGLVLTLAFLYWARPVLIPVALSILLAFLLSPMADGLQRIGLPRVASVIAVVLVAFSILGAVGWITARQVASFADELPRYKDNITEKASDLRQWVRGGPLEKVQQTVEDIKENVQKEDGKAVKTKPRVPIAETEPRRAWPIPFAGLVEFLTGAGLVVFLVIFILMEREDLRNRIIRLVGYGRMNVTTKALEEIAHRISRYLLMQSLINGTYGLAIATGLFLVGLPYALLWGFLAGVLRFIPYVGPWLGALLPCALALAVFPGWIWPLAVAALFVVLELLTAMVMEPLLYGHSAGVSQVALLVAIAFWTWLWGPVGLLMATPMTVCLVVLGKYIPQFHFIVVLMSDEPVMQIDASYYQRLLASDDDEAAGIVEKYLKDHPAEQIYDQILLPALYQAKCDYRRGKLSQEEERFVYQTTSEITDDLELAELKPPADSAPSPAAAPRDGAARRRRLRVLACPARDQADEIALRMLRRLLDAAGLDLEIARPVSAAEFEQRVDGAGPSAVLIGTVAPGGVAQTRHLAKRLRARFPHLKVLIGRWGLTADFAEIEEQRKLLLAAGADEVAATLLEARDLIAELDSSSSSRPPAEKSVRASLRG
ncbi:MAG: AI-2E family transporter [Candidatus Binatia bacterium]